MPLNTPCCPLLELLEDAAARTEPSSARQHAAGRGRAARNRVGDVRQQVAGLSAQQIGIGLRQAPPGVFDVQIVLQRQSDRVAQGEIDVPGPHQLAQPGGIGPANRLRGTRHVVPGEPTEPRAFISDGLHAPVYVRRSRLAKRLRSAGNRAWRNARRVHGDGRLRKSRQGHAQAQKYCYESGEHIRIRTSIAYYDRSRPTAARSALDPSFGYTRRPAPRFGIFRGAGC